MLNSYRLSCQKEVRKMLQLHRQSMRLDALLRQFKNSNEDYNKIRYTAEQAVRSVLSNGRQLLKIALLSLIESLRANPIKFDFLIHGMLSTVVMSKSTIMDYTGSSSSNYYTNPFSYYSNQNSYYETLAKLLVKEATILYEKMIKEFTDETMNNAATGNSSNVLP